MRATSSSSPEPSPVTPDDLATTQTAGAPPLTRLQASAVSMRGTKRLIAEWMLEAPARAVSAEATTTWIAQQTSTSDSAVVRLCQHLGYTGFPEFKLALSAQLATLASRGDETLLPLGIAPEDSVPLALEKLKRSHIASVSGTFELLEVDALARVIDAIREARSLVILGAGNSLPVAQSLHYRLLRLGLPSVFNEDQTLQAIATASRRHKLTVIAISHSGRTESVLHAAKLAKEGGGFLASILCDAASPLARISDVALFALAPEAEIGREALASRVAQLTVVDALYALLTIALGSEAVEALADTAKAYAQ